MTNKIGANDGERKKCDKLERGQDKLAAFGGNICEAALSENVLLE